MANAITAKARAIYGKRLTKEDYNNLLHKRGVSGVVAYLKTTEKYRATFANVNETTIHRGQVEQGFWQKKYLSFIPSFAALCPQEKTALAAI